MGGAAGELARSNAVRNPARTAASAAALMIGLTLVTTVAVLGQGPRSLGREHGRTPDHVRLRRHLRSRRDPAAARRPRDRIPARGRGIERAQRRGQGARDDDHRLRCRSGDDRRASTASASATARTPPWTRSPRAARSCARASPTSSDLDIGDRTRITTPSGRSLEVRVAGIIDPGKFDIDPLLGSLIVSQAAFDGAFPRAGDRFTFVNVPAEARRVRRGCHRAGRDALPRHRDRHEGRLRREPRRAHRADPEPALRAARPVGRRQPVRHGEHARAGRVRAHPRARDAARDRPHAPSDAPHGAARERHHRPDRRRRSASRSGSASQRPSRRRCPPTTCSSACPVGTLAVFVAVAVAAGIAAAIMPARRAGRLDVLEALQYQ